MNKKLENTVWVVTGAASGIGAAVVRTATSAGATVLALDISDATGATLASSTGAHYQHCDVSDPEDWQRVVETLQGFIPGGWY